MVFGSYYQLDMILKTIINCNQPSSLARPFALSISIHALAMLVWPRAEVRLESIEKVEQPYEYFVAVQQPLERPKALPKAEVKQAASTPKNQTELRTKRSAKRRVQRSAKRRVKRKTKRRITARKRAVQKPKAQANPQPESAPLLPAQEVAQAAPAPQASTESVARAQKSQVAPQPVRRRLSRGQLRGIVKGYYRTLNALMRQTRSYPRSARRLGLEGTVLVEMVVDKRGQIVTVKVARSSGHDVLDQAALAQIQELKKVPKIPHELNRRKMTFQIPFEYRLQS